VALAPDGAAATAPSADFTSAASGAAPGGTLSVELPASARAALRLCKAALKAEREMPAWAKTATLAGWKAPKGWQP
jgi:hypothetical protein